MYVPAVLAAAFFVLFLVTPLEAIFFPLVPVFLPLAVVSLAFEAFALLCLPPSDAATVRTLRRLSDSVGPEVAVSRDLSSGEVSLARLVLASPSSFCSCFTGCLAWSAARVRVPRFFGGISDQLGSESLFLKIGLAGKVAA